MAGARLFGAVACVLVVVLEGTRASPIAATGDSPPDYFTIPHSVGDFTLFPIPIASLDRTTVPAQSHNQSHDQAHDHTHDQILDQTPVQILAGTTILTPIESPVLDTIFKIENHTLDAQMHDQIPTNISDKSPIQTPDNKPHQTPIVAESPIEIFVPTPSNVRHDHTLVPNHDQPSVELSTQNSQHTFQSPDQTAESQDHDNVPAQTRAQTPVEIPAQFIQPPILSCIPTPPDEPSPSITGTIVRCPTAVHRKCLDLKKVPIDGKCYTVGSLGPCRDYEIVVVDKLLFYNSKELIGKCLPIYTCDESVFKEQMSYDQCCYEHEVIEKAVCVAEKNLRLRKNVFGEGECEFTGGENATSKIEKNSEKQLQEAECIAPDLSFPFEYAPLTPAARFPHLSVPHALLNVSVRCSAEERACLESGRVLVGRGAPGTRADAAGCHHLLARGPCEHGSWLVLERRALYEERRLEPICAWTRCAPDAVFLAAAKRCVTLRELQRERCASEDIVFDVFGDAHCTRFTLQEELLLLPTHDKDDECSVKPPRNFEGMLGALPRPDCASSDSKRCQLPASGLPVKPTQ